MKQAIGICRVMLRKDVGGLCLVGTLVAHALPASGADVFVYVGKGEQTDVSAIGVRTPVLKGWALEGGGSLNLMGEAEVGVYHGRQSPALNRDIVEVGLRPVLRWSPGQATSWRPYVDVGIGAHLLSHTSINEERRFGTAFQFGEHVAVGMAFCAELRCSLALRAEHISNAAIKTPNNGPNIGSVLFGYRL